MANEDLLPDLVNADISNINPRDAIAAAMIDRSAFVPQMTPDIRARLQTIVQGEVGHGASPEQQQVQLETAFNRAAARGQTLDQVTQQYTGPGSAGYYPASTFSGGRIRNPAEYERFQRTVVDPVLAGSDVGTQRLGFAPTGNASGGVASRGIASGRYNQAGQIGGETYVQQERADQLARLAALRRQGGGSFNVPTGAPTLTANDLAQDPAFAPQPAPIQVAQAGSQTLSDAAAEAGDAGNPAIPTEIPKAPLTPNQRVASGFDAMGGGAPAVTSAAAPMQGPAAPQQYGPRPSEAPIPEFNYVEPQDPGPKPIQPKPLPLSSAQNYAARYMENPDVSEGTRARMKRIYDVEESYRKELATRATTAYTNDLAQWNKAKDEFDKRTVSRSSDIIKGLSDQAALEEMQRKTRQAYRTDPLEVEKLQLQNRETAVKTNEVLQNMAGYNTQVINGVLYVAPKSDPNNWSIARGTPNFHLTGEGDKEFNLFAQGEVASRQLAKHDLNSMTNYRGAAAQQLAQTDAKGITGLWRMGLNGQLSREAQTSFNAALAWSEANLRTKSGAVMNRDEIAQNFHLFFPIPGDEPETILEKAQRRRAIEESNYLRLGTATPLGDRYRETMDALGLPTPLFSAQDPRYEKLKPGQLYIFDRQVKRKQ